MDIKRLRKELREAMADYHWAMGCGCCADRKGMEEAEERIAKLLNVPKYDDDSGYDFNKYRVEK